MTESDQNQKHTCGLSHKGCVSLVPIFNHLDVQQMDEIMETVQSQSFEKGELVYRAGDKSDVLTIVNKGSLRIYRLSESGKEQLVRVLRPGEFTGELALFNEKVHENYAEAMEPASVCQITRSDLQTLLVKYPSISLKILQELSARVDQSETQAARFTTESTEQRLALYLADLLGPGSESNIVTLPLTKKDLASYIGTTPETVSRKLKELEELNLIKRLSSSKIKILDEDNLIFL
ncbi:CRP/FNR family transcriptional regulator, anaerobic regulatory protein [Alkalibacterium putridalgicola]|uniref:Crp/Fnr family transcriptional regulator n=1 Tax=Alkalibacterium putridalgicola TaxID=426703 RepID=A0A1H7XNH3_9LACT|nr:Crp/Fnr family transcriptional regulator [Alkalibacterium putridalgicola]GEK90321.1 Crp/Fnr family transcriptional regulator [Alkalibacterium putridalgicola]SEM34539.1 CRP/FNR family transcriptional regulator, anaerobic regulatory protein [Alkalibacterium putridalgicola]